MTVIYAQNIHFKFFKTTVCEAKFLKFCQKIVLFLIIANV